MNIVKDLTSLSDRVKKEHVVNKNVLKTAVSDYTTVTAPTEDGQLK